MKALSLWNPPPLPWASLCVLGLKKFETRSRWHYKYRGDILIHATASVPYPIFLPQGTGEAAIAWKTIGEARKHPIVEQWGSLAPQGAVLGIVELTEVFTMDDIFFQTPPEPERSFGFYAPGRVALKLENPRLCRTPVPARGNQGLWTPDEALIAAVREELLP